MGSSQPTGPLMETSFRKPNHEMFCCAWLVVLHLLQVPLAVSILISSDFLQMQRLVAECLGFVGEHLTEIVKLPIDLSCLSDKMVLQLAKVHIYLLGAGCAVMRGHIRMMQFVRYQACLVCSDFTRFSLH